MIKAVNEGATSNADAPIKVIQDMKIAYLANHSSFGGQGQRRIYPLVPAADPGAAGGGPGENSQVPDPTAAFAAPRAIELVGYLRPRKMPAKIPTTNGKNIDMWTPRRTADGSGGG